VVVITGAGVVVSRGRSLEESSKVVLLYSNIVRNLIYISFRIEQEVNRLLIGR
jgi:hypothetical protein